jgi:hypothetical protein
MPSADNLTTLCADYFVDIYVLGLIYRMTLRTECKIVTSELVWLLLALTLEHVT